MAVNVCEGFRSSLHRTGDLIAHGVPSTDRQGKITTGKSMTHTTLPTCELSKVNGKAAVGRLRRIDVIGRAISVIRINGGGHDDKGIEQRGLARSNGCKTHPEVPWFEPRYSIRISQFKRISRRAYRKTNQDTEAKFPRMVLREKAGCVILLLLLFLMRLLVL